MYITLLIFSRTCGKNNYFTEFILYVNCQVLNKHTCSLLPISNYKYRLTYKLYWIGLYHPMYQ